MNIHVVMVYENDDYPYIYGAFHNFIDVEREINIIIDSGVSADDIFVYKFESDKFFTKPINELNWRSSILSPPI